jgi:O-antigen/teichoic acid export membrane protein
MSASSETEIEPGAESADAPAPKSAHGLVLRNTAFLVAAQIIGTPLSILVNAVLARHLGPGDFGYIYLAGTFASFGFLVVDWGQAGTLPAMVAKNHQRAGELFGTGLVWRLGSAVFVYGVLAGACHVLGYANEFQVALALVALGSTIAAFLSAMQDTIRGFERTDVAAYQLVGNQLLTALMVVPTVLLGGRLRAALTAQALASGIVAVFVWRALRSMRIGTLSFTRSTLRSLISEGTPFLSLSVVNALQPNIDALFLSKLAPAEVVGWHGAARKLVGVLVFPAASLISALYPTLCRLYGSNVDEFRRSVSGALRTSTILVVPVALGTALYADVGIRIFSRQSFGPAEDNLRILSVFIFLMYFSMILGASLAAAGLQRPWAVAQAACVVVSLVLDPLLVPWCQRHWGNGGLGVCASTVVSEILMVAAGFALTPRGVLDRTVKKGIALAFLAGGVMAVTARLLSGFSPFLAAPVSVAAYAASLWVSGGRDADQTQMIRDIIARKRRA